MHARYKLHILYLQFHSNLSQGFSYKNLCLYFAYRTSSSNLVSNINKSITLYTIYFISANRIRCEILTAEMRNETEISQDIGISAKFCMHEIEILNYAQ